jgi:hypothetical protein
MNTTIRLVSSAFTGTTNPQVIGDKVTVSGKKNNVVVPNANVSSIVEVQTQSYENPKYIISNVMLTGSSGILTYPQILQMYRWKYTGTNKIYLTVGYGTASTLVGVDGTTTSIPVMLDDFSLDISAKDTKSAYLPTASLTFVETL